MWDRDLTYHHEGQRDHTRTLGEAARLKEKVEGPDIRKSRTCGIRASSTFSWPRAIHPFMSPRMSMFTTTQLLWKVSVGCNKTYFQEPKCGKVLYHVYSSYCLFRFSMLLVDKKGRCPKSIGNMIV